MSLCTIYYVFSEKMRDGRRDLVMSLCTMYYVFSEKMRDGRRGLCSPGTSFAPLGESHGKGTEESFIRGQTLRLLERIGLRADSLKTTTGNYSLLAH